MFLPEYLNKLPDGYFVLADAGYALVNRRVLVPYRGVRYHLKEFGEGYPPPRNAQELFNLRHSSLRTVVERTFGVLKRQWAVLRTVCECNPELVMLAIYCAVFLNNFLLDCGDPGCQVQSDVQPDCCDDDDEMDESNENETPINDCNRNNIEAKKWRDDLAAAMWDDFIQNHPQPATSNVGSTEKVQNGPILMQY